MQRKISFWYEAYEFLIANFDRLKNDNAFTVAMDEWTRSMQNRANSAQVNMLEHLITSSGTQDYTELQEYLI